MFRTLHRIVIERLVVGAVQQFAQDRTQGFIDQRGFARTADARHADQLAERELDIDILQVIAPCSSYNKTLAVAGTQFFGNFDPATTGEVIRRNGIRMQDIVERTGRDDPAALASGQRSHIDDIVRRPHHILVVLDHDDRIARIAQLLEAADQPLVVALVQTDGRLVENIKHVHQLRADLGRQADALALAARQRTRGTGQGEIAQSDFDEEAEPLADLLDDLLGDLPLLGREIFFDVGDPLRKTGDRHRGHFGDVQPPDAEMKRLVPQARTAADAAFLINQELLAPLAAPGGVLVLGAADVFGHAFPGDQVVAARRAELGEIDRQRLGIPVQNGIHTLLGNRPHRIVEREIVTPPQHFENGEKHVVAILAERLHAAITQGQRRIGQNLLPVEDRLLPQTVAMRAGSLRRVEGESVRRRIFERHTRRRTHQMARIVTHLPRFVVIDGHRSFALPHRFAQRGEQTLAQGIPDGHAVDHQVDRMDLVPVELHTGGELPDLAVDTGIEITFLDQAFEQLPVMALAPLDDRGRHSDLASVELFENQLDDLFVRIVDHLLARDRRVSPRSPRIEQAQEIADLGYGTDRRTGILVGGLLLDGHHRAESRDLIDIGPFHRADELPGIGRKRLHIAALPFGIDRIESQGRLAGTRKSCDDDQFPARNFQIDVLQVMHPRTEYFDVVFFHDE